MLGIFVALSILAATLILFTAVYNRETGRNFPKDIFKAILGKEQNKD